MIRKIKSWFNRDDINYEEISDTYLDALQRLVDQHKPADFALTPIGEAGWGEMS